MTSVQPEGRFGALNIDTKIKKYLSSRKAQRGRCLDKWRIFRLRTKSFGLY